MSKKDRKLQLKYALEVIARHERIFDHQRIELNALKETVKQVNKYLITGDRRES